MDQEHNEPQEPTGLRKLAESIMGSDVRDPDDLPPEGIATAFEELRTHQIELELQNEALLYAQEELVASRDRYSDLYDSSPVGYVTISNKGMIVEANLTLATMLDTDRAALVGTSFSAFIVDEGQDTLYLHRRELIETRLRRICELQLRKGKDSPFWVRLDGIAVASPDDSGDQLRLTVIDITERKHSEEDLRKSERRFKSLFEHAGDYILVLEPQPDGPPVIVDANEAALEKHGFKRDELMGKSILDLDKKLNRKELAEKLERLMAGEHIVFETIHTQKDGSPFSVEVSAKLLAVGEDSPVIISIERDVTERKLVEDKLRQAQKLEAIGLLAGGVAHDFRNQLTIIQGYADRLLRLSLVSEDEGRSSVEEILKAAKRSAITTGQLLAFSKQELLRPEVIDIIEVVSDIAKALPKMIGEDIRISISFGCSACSVKLDANQLQQAVLNLVVNARHAMLGSGELIIETSCIETDASLAQRHTDMKPGPYVMLSVTDSGCGMDAETLGNIFDPFFSTREVGEGTGLGLAMVYGFVKQSDGAIEVDSEPGQGSTFRLYFPRTEAAAAPISGIEIREDMPRGSETVLLVEDEGPLRRMLMLGFQELGYTIIEADSAVAAMPLAEQYEGQIDILVTDCVMPGMNGVQLAECVRESRPEIEVLYITGYKGADLAQHGLEGVDSDRLLIKPFSSDDVIRRIRGILDSKTS
jgi:two-component system, cell cycle sensor histidine kinase and response regulator CckA